MTLCHFFMFHDFSMTTFIVQVFQEFQSVWEPCSIRACVYSNARNVRQVVNMYSLTTKYLQNMSLRDEILCIYTNCTSLKGFLKRVDHYDTYDNSIFVKRKMFALKC